MQAMLASVTNGFMVAKPFLGALVLFALLVLIGDRGSKISLKRNSPCLAALCIFTFALGAGMTAWYLVMKPLFALFGAAFTLSYSLILMYWAFWLLVGVLISAKALVYDASRRHSHLP